MGNCKLANWSTEWSSITAPSLGTEWSNITAPSLGTEWYNITAPSLGTDIWTPETRSDQIFYSQKSV